VTIRLTLVAGRHGDGLDGLDANGSMMVFMASSLSIDGVRAFAAPWTRGRVRVSHQIGTTPSSKHRN